MDSQPIRRTVALGSIIAGLALVSFAPAANAALAKESDHCTIVGTKGADTLRGTPKRDVICGKGGADKISGKGGNDYIVGGEGNDRIDGGSGADTLIGEGGNDKISGGIGDDGLYGEAGNDKLDGGKGKDLLYGDVGDDNMDGGPGEDHVAGGPGKNLGEPLQDTVYPDCPTNTPICKFHLHHDSVACPNYANSGVGICVGRTPYANLGWEAFGTYYPALYANFGWIGQYQKRILYDAVNGIPVGHLEGDVPSPNSANFTVSKAWALKWSHPDTIWVTPNLPGKAAGTVGGPLYLNFVGGYVGADAYIDGYLYNTTFPPPPR